MGSPPMVPQNPQQTQAQKVSALLSALSQIAPSISNIYQGAKGGGAKLISPGIVGQVPQMPGRPAAPVGPPSQLGGTGTPNSPQSGLFQTGFEFNNPQARNAAVATSAIQGVTQFIDQVKQRKEAKTAKQAENYMTQITAAQQAGDQEALNMLLEDPKVVKTLEKGLEFIMPKVPGEPPPPEAVGVTKALQKMQGKNQQQARLPAPNTPGGVIWPRMPQSVGNEQAIKDLTSSAALGKLQQDPQLAATLGTGTGLTGQEARDAERYQSGLALAPADERKAFLANQGLIEQLDADNKKTLAEIASREKIAMAGLSSAERQARISAGPLYFRAQIAKDIADSQIKIKQAVMSGNVSGANKIAMQTITSQIDNLRSNAEKAAKDGHDDMAADFKKQADDLQGQYDQLRKSQDLDVDRLLQDLMNE